MARWTRRPHGPGWRLVKGASRLLGVLPHTIDGAVVIVVDLEGVPRVGHNLNDRGQLPRLLREVADAVEAKIANGN